MNHGDTENTEFHRVILRDFSVLSVSLWLEKLLGYFVVISKDHPE